MTWFPRGFYLLLVIVGGSTCYAAYVDASPALISHGAGLFGGLAWGFLSGAEWQNKLKEGQ